MNLFQSALKRQNDGRPPVWFMRQAGRYHAHYQALRKQHSFMDVCKVPAVACAATMGPIRDFGFDAAILFSDLLFPLESMGMGLTYENGPPELSWHLRAPADLARLEEPRLQDLAFQGEAMKLIRKELDPSKGLLGFVGGPLTLFSYAVEGSHKGGLPSAKEGLRDGRFDGFNDKLVGLLADNMVMQARGGADVVAMLDTCAGEIDPVTYGERVVPVIAETIRRFKAQCPQTALLYYSKGTGSEHWQRLENISGIDGIGIDWHHDVAPVIDRYADRWAVQGGFDPHLLFLDAKELEPKLRAFFAPMRALPAAKRRGWICGLGHGVLPKTPEANVRLFVQLQREVFGS